MLLSFSLNFYILRIWAALLFWGIIYTDVFHWWTRDWIEFVVLLIAWSLRRETLFVHQEVLFRIRCQNVLPQTLIFPRFRCLRIAIVRWFCLFLHIVVQFIFNRKDLSPLVLIWLLADEFKDGDTLFLLVFATPLVFQGIFADVVPRALFVYLLCQAVHGDTLLHCQAPVAELLGAHRADKFSQVQFLLLRRDSWVFIMLCSLHTVGIVMSIHCNHGLQALGLCLSRIWITIRNQLMFRFFWLFAFNCAVGDIRNA